MNSKDTTIILVKSSVFIGWALIIFFVFISSIPSNPVSPPKKISSFVKVLAPQGFSFFTKNPKEPSPNIYQRVDSSWVKKNYKNFSSKNLFGLSKTSRAMMVELGSIMGKVPEKKWKKYPLPIKQKLPDSLIRDIELPLFSLRNTSPTPTLCGLILVTKKEYIPWAWSKSDHLEMPAESVILKLQCN